MKYAMKKCCLIRDLSFNCLVDNYELETEFVLNEKISLVLADRLYNSSKARSNFDSAYKVFCKRY